MWKKGEGQNGDRKRTAGKAGPIVSKFGWSVSWHCSLSRLCSSLVREIHAVLRCYKSLTSLWNFLIFPSHFLEKTTLHTIAEISHPLVSSPEIWEFFLSFSWEKTREGEGDGQGRVGVSLSFLRLSQRTNIRRDFSLIFLRKDKEKKQRNQWWLLVWLSDTRK